HVHVVWNTVSYETGKKFHQSKQDLYRAFEIKDGLDEEYQIRKVEHRRTRDRVSEKAQRLYERDPESYIWTEDLKLRIATAKERAGSFEQFRESMQSQGVEIRERGKEEKLTYVFTDEDGKQRQIREGKLGSDYGRRSIEQEIDNRANARGKGV